MQKVLLSMKNITKRFGVTVALDNANCDLKEGEILAILGENGAGKSTLMKLLCGFYPCGSFDGSIQLGGKPMEFKSVVEASRNGIAMIYQELNLELDLSVAENIMLGEYPKTKIGLIDKHAMKKRAGELLKMMGQDLDLDMPVRYYSASIQQIICIARTLARNPKVLILDEPTSALTGSETNALMEIIKELISKGLSCIYISHKLDEVFNISDRIIVLRDGRNISEYDRKDFDGERIVQDIVGHKIDKVEGRNFEATETIMEIRNFTLPHPFSPNKNILENISFELKQGEILGLAGLVGAGRSELLRAIFGAYPKKSGEVFIKGNKVDISNPRAAKSAGIGFLTEDRKKDGIISTMNICQNSTLCILENLVKKLFMSNKIERRLSEKYFTSLGVKAASTDVPITSLSGGNQQKVVLAKWLLTDLKILFLDEPTRGIDVGTKDNIYKIINSHAEKGLSVIIVSSELPELISLCDRFLVLADGKIQANISKQNANQEVIMQYASR